MPKKGVEPVRREQLIRATFQTIDEIGMADATVATIAKKAGLSSGIVAHYFGDKDGLLEATMRHVLRDLWQATARRRRAAKADPR
ncbi:TetR family transcriptional regulator, partial [Mesorhizobium sp. M1C.F.Ca.ET.176.01.1.1]|uniref:TetR family transcriptional regulator n=1 Tax=Mesorhizobium sp. M1C.F.Ca.ET.176.01.1.1 TaxID=2563922 RepID=UPI0010939460